MDLSSLLDALPIDEVERNKKSSILKTFATTIGSEHTDIVTGNFSSNFVIIASQYQKLGALIKVTVDEVESDLETSVPVYTVRTLFGSENELQLGAARYLAEKLNLNKSLLIFLALKSYSVETVRSLAEFLKNVQ